MSTAGHHSRPAELDNRPAALRASAELVRMLDKARRSKGVDVFEIARACDLYVHDVADVFGGNVAVISEAELSLISTFCGLTSSQALHATELGRVARRSRVAMSPLTLSPPGQGTPAGANKTSSVPLSERDIRNMTLLTPADLEIVNRVDLANTLKRVMKRANLGPAKVALKSGIARSQVYNLIDARRDALPRKPEQIHAFLQACRVPPTHIDALLRQWARLNRKRSNYRRFSTPESVPAPTAATPTPAHGDSIQSPVVMAPPVKRTRVRLDTGEKTIAIGVLQQSQLRNVQLVERTWQDKLVTWCKPPVLRYQLKRGLVSLAPLTPLMLPAGWFWAKPDGNLFSMTSWAVGEWILTVGSALATVLFTVLAVVIRRQRARYHQMLEDAAAESDPVKRSQATLARAALKGRRRK